MYQFAILIGLYSYSIFFIGLLGMLEKPELAFLTVLVIVYILFRLKNTPPNVFRSSVSFVKNLNSFEKIILLILPLQILVNFIGVLGPELSFDALWYHLTLPKIFLSEHRVFHVAGGLLYYSDMPKLIEMVYIPAIAFGSEIYAKIIQFGFGLGILFVIYKLSRRYVNVELSLIAVVIFYSNLVVDWLSIASYVDLGRAFFEVLAIYYFLDYFKDKRIRSLIISSIMLGLTFAAKINSGLDILIFIPIMLYFRKPFTDVIIFMLFFILVPLPWFIFAYINTGNPFYPLFSNLLGFHLSFGLSSFLNLIHSQDPISPVYIIFLPLIFTLFRKFARGEKILASYGVLSLILWIVSPQIGGGRFIAAYLPAYSVLVVIALKYLNPGVYKRYLLFLVVFLSLVSISYRAAANARYIPVIIGYESKQNFLARNLNFSFGDFYDVDGYFKKTIKPGDRVLIYGIHNLYYVNFPFIHESWYKKGDYFNYVLVRGTVPQEFRDSRLIYVNDKTHVKLYKIIMTSFITR